MRKNDRRVLHVSVLFLFFALIGALVDTMTRGDVKRLGAGSALNSPLVVTPLVDQPVSVPQEYYPTRIPAEQRASIQTKWQTYAVPGEGLTFRARLDWPVTSGKPKTIRYTSMAVVFRDTGSSVVFQQLDNAEGLSLEAFGKTQSTDISGSGHDAKWLAADIRQFIRDVSNSQYKRLLIVRDDSKADATASISGLSKYTVLVAYDRRVLIARSEPDMSPEAEQHFWEVLDSLQFMPIQ